MATQTTSSSSSSSSSSPSWKYDVFLSFCGDDTRKNFTDHLYTALKQKGIITFRDDEKLERGKYISSELLKAIEESKYAIIVLSRNYASSRWCLIELAKIVGCMKENRLTVLPVFHYVDPSHVRNQTGTLTEAFAKHEKDPKINIQDVQEWKAAMKEVGNISGWDLHDRPESIVIQEILGKIFSELNRKFSSACKDLVGIASRVEEMLGLYLGEGLGGVRFVGICGMGGSGKTTLAQEIYKRISGNFDASCFIDNVREETKNQGLVSLQKQILRWILMEKEINIRDLFVGIDLIVNRLRTKKVLIVLDDVDGEEQLEALAGKHDWFGVGSRIIVTSRDSHLLRRHGVDDVFTTKGLNDDEALELFSWRAFKKPHPEENYVDLSKDFVNYTNGLPLALNVFGSFLFGRSMDAWKSARDQLKVEPNNDILDILKISFDGLMDMQKQLFLDIAFFFKGEDKDCIRDILESFGYYPDYNLGVLVDKSLIFIEEKGTLWMPYLLQDMGKEIVRRESPKEPGGRSRLWLYEDVLHVLKKNSGTEAVEGIMLNTHNEKEEHLSAEAFSKMKKLRLLKIGNMQLPQGLIRGNVQLPQDLIRCNVQLPEGLNYLSNELRVIEWHGYPLKSMPTNFQPNQLVELRLRWSRIKQLWKGILILDELKVIDLSDSKYLIETPEFSGIPNLKQLILQRCTRLSKIHASLGNLKQLIRLDLRGCERLESLPHMINLESLEVFILSGCSRLKKFPEIVGNMSRLSELYLNETAIKTLPVEHLPSLKMLKAKEFPTPKIQKVRDVKNFEKYYKPRLLSLGPIHHGKEEYQLGEKYKLAWAFEFIDSCRKTMDNLYKKIEEKIEELRDCYEEEVTQNYDDEDLAWLLFVDGCAILQFIYCAINKGKSKLGIINNSVDFVHRDLFLLENQLPYCLLKLLMSDNEKELRDSIKTYIQMRVMVPEGKPEEQRILRDEEPIHLLDLLRTALLGNPHEDSVIIRNRERDQHRISGRNIQELKAAGIHLRRSSSSCLRDISFSQSLNLLGHLYIPPITLNNLTRPMFLNLVAYEKCDNFKNDFGVTSYIAFLCSLIKEAKDVRELRKAGIFYNLVGSDEEVAKLFNEMPFIPTNIGVEEKIEEYYGSMLSQMFRIYHGNFNSTSWGIFKLLVVVLGLIGIKYTTRMYPFIHASFITYILLALSLSMSTSLIQRVLSS